MESDLNLYIAPDVLHVLTRLVAPILTIVVLLLLPAMWRWRWRDYLLPARLVRRSGSAAPGEEQAAASSAPAALVPPQVSLVVPCYNCASALSANLPALLEQKGVAYEVVVVDEASTDDTREVLAACAQRYPNLRHTFVPATARYVDRRKLAITLGIRAARAPWVVITAADCRPASADWLALMAMHFNDTYDFVIGYANYAADGTAATRRAIFERLRRLLTAYRTACGGGRLCGDDGMAFSGRATGGDSANMAVRKSWFLERKGYADSLTVDCGEDDLLIDALATAGRTAVEVRAAATVGQEAPVPEVLATIGLARCETRHRKSGRSHRFSIRDAAASCAVYASALCFIAYAALRALTLAAGAPYAIPDIVADVAMVLILAADICLPTFCLRSATRTLGTIGINAWHLAGYALANPWRHMALQARWRLHRRDFIRR